MHLPWHNKTGIPKAIAILATIGILAFGLCTANVVLGEPDPVSKWRKLLQFTIPVCAITFFACMIAVAVLVDLSKRRSKRNSQRKPL
jgi:amino acid transporter